MDLGGFYLSVLINGLLLKGFGQNSGQNLSADGGQTETNKIEKPYFTHILFAHEQTARSSILLISTNEIGFP